MKLEGIIPALESAHRLAQVIKLAPTMRPDETIVLCLSGRGDKDVESVGKHLGMEILRPGSPRARGCLPRFGRSCCVCSRPNEQGYANERPLHHDRKLGGLGTGLAISLAELVTLVIVALLLHGLVFRYIRRLAEPFGTTTLMWVDRMRPLVRLMLLVAALALTSSIAPLTRGEAGLVQTILLVATITIIAWSLWIAVRLALAAHMRRFRSETADPFLARKHLTQTQILERVASFVIWLVAIGAMLMSFEGVRQYGVSLLASAGAAGLIIGLALQPVLKNLIAGIQIALTQPIRIGDALIAEGEYGTVEEIGSTYVVVRLWDLRRLVVPLSYFIEQPFQNWTRHSTELVGRVMLYADYDMPVDLLRERLKTYLAGSPHWNGKTFAVQVTEFTERGVELRILVSAKDAGTLFDLRCDVREFVLGLLQSEMSDGRPRVRAQVDEVTAAIAAV